MVSCYDCELFGIECKGVVPPMEFRNRIHEYCEHFKVVAWRKELFKPGGTSRI
jgi:hypothetical protein